MAPAILAKGVARPVAAPALELMRERRFAKAAKAYAEAQALTLGRPRSLDIRL